MQCCGAGDGAARGRIILVEPEPQRDAAPAPTVLVPTKVFTLKYLYKKNGKKWIILLHFPFVFTQFEIHKIRRKKQK
jgi:hypothetical protein